MGIETALRQLRTALEGSSARLVAVSKTFPAQDILTAYEAGQRIFGESTAQELNEKYLALPKNIEWHFIGHLQSNKVKYIAPYVHLIHAVDSFKLLQTIDKEAAKNGRVIDVLLQLDIADEETKFGLSEAEIIDIIGNPSFPELHHVRICGLMGIATQTEDELKIEGEFIALQRFFLRLQNTVFSDRPYFKEISMGMSHDYLLALKYGASLVRVGSLIFGRR